LVSKIDGLNVEIKKMLADREGLEFMVFHPAWGYFAQAYGLQQVPIEIEEKNQSRLS
jgi:zinc transport system substrate-binding protein